MRHLGIFLVVVATLFVLIGFSHAGGSMGGHGGKGGHGGLSRGGFGGHGGSRGFGHGWGNKGWGSGRGHRGKGRWNRWNSGSNEFFG